jgi:hypothetical protein
VVAYGVFFGIGQHGAIVPQAEGGFGAKASWIFVGAQMLLCKMTPRSACGYDSQNNSSGVISNSAATGRKSMACDKKRLARFAYAWTDK